MPTARPTKRRPQLGARRLNVGCGNQRRKGWIGIDIVPTDAADIVRDHQTGIVVNPGDVEGLQHAIRMLYSQPDLRKTLGENGHRVAEQYFDRSTISTRFIDHLESCL